MKPGTTPYKNLHQWVARKFGRPNQCELCDEPSDRFEWSNKSGQYLKQREDWQRLCVKCHRNYDAASYEGNRFTGHKHTEESKAKISGALKTRVQEFQKRTGLATWGRSGKFAEWVDLPCQTCGNLIKQTLARPQSYCNYQCLNAPKRKDELTQTIKKMREEGVRTTDIAQAVGLSLQGVCHHYNKIKEL